MAVTALPRLLGKRVDGDGTATAAAIHGHASSLCVCYLWPQRKPPNQTKGGLLVKVGCPLIALGRCVGGPSGGRMVSWNTMFLRS